MKIINIKAADYVKSSWSGGTTTQLAIFPNNAIYANKDFLWRVSSATVELAKSDFTKLVDYKRFISVLNGEMKLSHPQKSTDKIALNPYQIYEFDGGIDTSSEGICTDFNLMIRKGKCDGNMTCVILEKNSEKTLFFGLNKSFIASQTLIYCSVGSAVISVNNKTQSILQGDSILLEDDSEYNFSISTGKNSTAKLMIANIFIIA